jgi:AcrR family transcriptional regulator
MTLATAGPETIKPRRLPAGQRREHLLDVAAAIILDSGFEALTMESVAERAGVSKGLGYAYFDNAEELALALYDREMAEFYRRILAATAARESFDERMRRALHAHLNVIAERGVLFVILQNKLSGRKLKRTVRQRLAPFIDFWSLQMAQEFNVDRATAETVAHAMLTAADIFGRALHAKRLAKREIEALVADFVLGGIHASLESASRRRNLTSKPLLDC